MLNKIAPDKWRHFLAGIVMGTVLQTAAWFVLPERPVAGIIIVLVMVVVISYGFELLSLLSGRGHHDIMDAVASIAGGVAGMSINWGTLYLLQ